MPGKGHIPDLTERIVRTLKANTNRSVGGLGSMASPSQTRDRVAASRRGNVSLPPTARSSKIDTFSIADDSDSTFTCTFAPLVDSWNLKLNGIDVEAAEFSISGKVITIGDAADLFLGADTQGSPWTLEIQYDYLTGVPTAPTSGIAPTELHTRVDKDTTSTASVTFTTFTAGLGTLILFAVANANGGTVTAPAGYTEVATHAESGLRLTIFAKTSDGTETSVSAAISGTAGSWCGLVLNFEAATVVGTDSASLATAAALTSGSVAAPLVVDFFSGLTSGSKSGAFLVIDPTLSGGDATFIGYVGLQAGSSSTVDGGFDDTWGMDGLDQVTGHLVSIVVGLEA